MSFSSRALHLGATIGLSLLSSCESLYGGFGVDNPGNCVVNSALCQAPDQACNPVTRECEPAIVISAIDPPVSSVLGGELATLTGQRFTPELRVRVGGREVTSLSVSSDRSLSFVLPAGASPAGRASIELSHPAGQTQRRDDLFRYYEDVQLMAGQPVTLPFTAKYARVADFNADGRQDIVLSDAFAGGVVVLLGQGDGGFAAPLTSTFSGRAYGLAVGDVNGDGFPDVAVSLTGPTSTIEVSLGNGDGTLRTAVPVTTQTTLGALGLGDFDGDRRADLVAADDLKLRFWHSNGDGSFSTPSTDMPLSYQSFGASGRMWLADFDGDSALDILAINGRDFSFPVLFGKGNGTFSESAGPLYSGAPNLASLGDSDGDGLLDILTPLSQVDNPIALSLQGPGRAFKQPMSYVTPINLTGCELRDLNSDGVVDLLAFSNFGTAGAMVILHGLGAGRFAKARSYTMPPFPQLVITAQLDGDQRPDLLVMHRGASGAGNFYSVFRNVTP